MKFTPMRLTVLALCLIMMAATVPGLMQSSLIAGPRVQKPGDDGGGSGNGGPNGMFENVLIQTDKPYSSVVSAITAAGGSVTHTYENFNGIAARIPRSAIRTIGLLTGPGRITKDLIVPAPVPWEPVHGKMAGLERTGDERRIAFDSVRAIAAPDLASILADHPDAYAFNNASTNIDALLADGFTGNGVVVGVIDSGLKPGFAHIAGSVVGCDDFVPSPSLGCSNSLNDGHGTFVAGMITSSVIFGFNPLGALFQSVSTHLPGSILPPNGIPMVGSAPLSSIYALRVFPPGAGSPSSRILAAVDRAIQLRDMFEDGIAGGVKIQVVNMSLGGPSIFPGRDIFDTAVNALLDHDIVMVTSASNDGPSGLSIGSPGSSFGAITTGAANIAEYERILRDLTFRPPGFIPSGIFFRPSSHIQTATFSSRGPNADGRGDPDVTASGFASFGQGFNTPFSIELASGTSFSSPTVAGVAAVLREAFPAATALQVRNAIIASANPNILGDNPTKEDQGNGYVDAQAARLLLAGGGVPDFLPTPPTFNRSVKVNLETNAGLDVRSGSITQHVGPLKPGERGEVLYRVAPNTAQVVISIANFSAGAQQNPLFGDDLFFRVHTAKTSNLQGGGYFGFPAFVTGGTFVINDPETGIIRVTPSGDWTNAGDVEADVIIFSVANPLPGFSDQRRVVETDSIQIPFHVPAGTSLAEVRLSWRENWGRYPVNDIDLFLVDPFGIPNFDGATLDSPENVIINNPIAGGWIAIVAGFEFHTPDDKYKLRIALDGIVFNQEE